MNSHLHALKKNFSFHFSYSHCFWWTKDNQIDILWEILFKTAFLISLPVFWLKIDLILIVFQGISHSQKPFVFPFFLSTYLIFIRKWSYYLDKIVAFCLEMLVVLDCPIYCGKVFSYIEGKLSHKIREYFPKP